MSADNQTVTNPMTQLDYAERRLEDRDTGTQSASALLSGLACGMGVLSLWFAPMVLGFIGIACGILGVAIAVLLSSSRAVQKALYPYAVFFQTVPIVAIAPLLVIWFGYGLQTVIASSFIVSIFPVIANTLTGLISTEPALREMFQLYGASPTVTLFKLRFPAALPQIFTGLRVAAGLAVIRSEEHTSELQSH